MRPLPRGIVADDHVGTVAFRPRRVDPGILFELATTHAGCPLPTPTWEARHPLPGDRAPARRLPRPVRVIVVRYVDRRLMSLSALAHLSGNPLSTTGED
jgi:hypothetical protein